MTHVRRLLSLTLLTLLLGFLLAWAPRAARAQDDEDDFTFVFVTDGTPSATLTGVTVQTLDIDDTSATTPVTANAPTGWHFVDWTVDTTTGTQVFSTDNPIVVVDREEDTTLTAHFAIDQFVLTYLAGPNGSIMGVTPQIVDYGTSGTPVTAVPDTGYHFVQWSDGSTSATRVDVNVTTDTTVTAFFAIDQFTLTYLAGPHGLIFGSTLQTVDFGTSGTAVTAVPDTGYHFVQWSDGVLTATRLDTNVQHNITVTALFAIDQFTLTYLAGPNGQIIGSTTQTVDFGTSGTAVTALPNTGYHFVQWSDGVLTATRIDTNVQANITVTATFAINQYTLTYLAGPNGTISGTTPQTVAFGGDGTPVTAVPNTGYHFVQWSDGVMTATRTDTDVQGNITVTASFAINQYTLTYNAGPNGTISGTTPQTVAFGGDGTPVTAVPNTGYHFVQWSDGVLTATRTDTNVQANITVTASFAINQYTLTYNAGPNGTISGTTPQTVNFGGDGTPVTAVPNLGYQFVQWSDGVLTATRTDTNVQANITVTATFTLAQYTLTYLAGPNGSISGTTPQTVFAFQNGTTVIAVPDPGFHFVQWSDGTLTASRADQDVVENITVTATFAANVAGFTLTVTTAGDGTGTVLRVPDESSYSPGTTVTLTAIPGTNSTFTGWAGDATGTSSTIVIVMNANKNVTAFFDENEGRTTYTVRYRGCTIVTADVDTSGVLIVQSTGPEGEGSVILKKAKVQPGATARDNDHDGDDSPWQTLTFTGPSTLPEVRVTGAELKSFYTETPIFLLDTENDLGFVTAKNTVINNIVVNGRLGSVKMNAVTTSQTTNIVSASDPTKPLSLTLSGVTLTGLRTEQTVKKLSVASKKTKTATLVGVIGDSANSTATLVLAPQFGTIAATAGVHAEIMAGYTFTTTTQTATPMYTGQIKSISATSKTGTLSGEVFVKDETTVKFKPKTGTANNTMVLFDATHQK